MSDMLSEELSQKNLPGIDEDDVFNILVATDVHLGYAEKDAIKGQDTFVTFEEILKIAVEEEVDFLLLGGDLFHETRPSAYCIYKCTELLKRYCLGDKPIQIEYLSDPSRNFAHTGNVTVNYEDPNLNVSLPVFSIHGNHDDPTGEHQISALNLMASTGLVNYFGKWDDFSHVQVEPILLQKGNSKLALYGLSHIKDERLGRLFLDKKVTFMSPPDMNEWFHLLVWHQNRANRGVKNFIPDHALPDIIDLVIWGHEHDCRISPELTVSGKVYISQPGSSVATSLSQGESIPKHVGLLRIYKNQFYIRKIPLNTIRPFIYREIVLKDLNELNMDNYALNYSDATIKIIEQEVLSMINEAKNLGRRGKMLPLLRLQVEYKDERQVFNTIRFGQKYIDSVANPEDMIRMRPHIKKTKPKKEKLDFNEITENGLPEFATRVEDLVSLHFEDEKSPQLKCLSVKALNEAVMRYIDSNDTDAPAFIVEHLVKDTRCALQEEFPPPDSVDNIIQNVKMRREQAQNYIDSLQQLLTERKTTTSSASTDNTDYCAIDSGDENVSNISSPNPARASGSRGGRPRRGRGSRGPRRGSR